MLPFYSIAETARQPWLEQRDEGDVGGTGSCPREDSQGALGVVPEPCREVAADHHPCAQQCDAAVWQWLGKCSGGGWLHFWLRAHSPVFKLVTTDKDQNPEETLKSMLAWWVHAGSGLIEQLQSCRAFSKKARMLPGVSFALPWRSAK